MVNTSYSYGEGKQWFLVLCKSKQEARASLNFYNQLIEYYFPTVGVIKIVRGRKQIKTEALFPGYLFVHLDILSGLASKVNYTTGVYGFVKFSGKPQNVPDELLTELKELNNDVIDTNLKSGDRVVFSGGQYKDINAIFLEAESEKRSILLIELLTQQVKLLVENIEINSISVN